MDGSGAAVALLHELHRAPRTNGVSRVGSCSAWSTSLFSREGREVSPVSSKGRNQSEKGSRNRPPTIGAPWIGCWSASPRPGRSHPQRDTRLPRAAGRRHHHHANVGLRVKKGGNVVEKVGVPPDIECRAVARRGHRWARSTTRATPIHRRRRSGRRFRSESGDGESSPLPKGQCEPNNRSPLPMRRGNEQ